MKSIKIIKIMGKVILFVTLFVLNQNFAQSITGKVVYKKSMEIDVSRINNNEYKDWAKSINASLEKMNYVLEFNNTQSVFYLEKSMDNDFNKLNRRAVTMGKGKRTFYSNIKNSTCIEENLLGSDVFLVDIPKPILKLTKETKILNGYICYKATSTEFVDFSNIKNMNMKDKVNEIIVWYTNDIPFQFGPINYFGLPGLILELKYDNTTYTATQISIKNKKSEIKKPNKGIHISNKEYDEMLTKRIEQLRNQ